MGWEAPWHWVIVAIIVIALFGYKKMPDAARSLGRSLRIFKTEIKGMSDDDKAREAAKDSTAQPVTDAAPTPVVAPAPPVTPEPTVPAAPAEVQTPVTTP